LGARAARTLLERYTLATVTVPEEVEKCQWLTWASCRGWNEKRSDRQIAGAKTRWQLGGCEEAPKCDELAIDALNTLQLNRNEKRPAQKINDGNYSFDFIES